MAPILVLRSNIKPAYSAVHTFKVEAPVWRFLSWLMGFDDGRCRCTSSTHGHLPGQCRKDAARSGALCASCFEQAADKFQDTH
jgi:hypothetical protein